MLSNTSQQNLDCAMLQTDVVFTNIKENIIVIIGNSKSGKSTLASIFAGMCLISIEQYGQTFLEHMSKQKTKIDETLLTCTTVCNRIDFENYTLLDMPSYYQNQDKQHIFLYSIYKLFHSNYKIKFILAISQIQCTQPLARQRFATFYNYLAMFKNVIKLEQFKQQIFNSTRIIITKATRPKSSLMQLFKGNHFFLQKSLQQELPMKKQLASFMNFLINNQNVVDILPLAEANSYPQYLEMSQDPSWTYLNMAQIKRKYGQFWNRNLRQCYSAVGKQSKSKLIQSFQRYQNLIKDSLAILQLIISISIGHDNRYLDKIDYFEITEKLKLYLKNYHYNIEPSTQELLAFTQQELINKQSSNSISKSGFQILKLLSKIHHIFQKMWIIKQPQTQIFAEIKQAINYFKVIYSNNRQQQIMFVRFSFYFLRGIYQNYFYHKLDLMPQENFFVRLNYSFPFLFYQNFYESEYSFFKQMTIQIYIRLFPTPKQQQSYIKYVNTFIIEKLSQIPTIKQLDLIIFLYEHILKQKIAIDSLVKAKMIQEAISLRQVALAHIEELIKYLNAQLQSHQSFQCKPLLKQAQMIILTNINQFVISDIVDRIS